MSVAPRQPGGGQMTSVAYHRRPRVPVTVSPTETLLLRTPPVQPVSRSRTLRLLQLGAPIAGAGTGLVFLISYRQSPLLLIAMGAAIGVGVLVSAATAVAQALADRGQRRGTRSRYLDYLAAEEARIRDAVASQEAGEALVHPDEDGLLGLASARVRVFERRPTDPDWLELRAGSGGLPPSTRVSVQEIDPLGSPPDPGLLAAARTLAERYRVRPHAVQPISLANAGTVVIRGAPDRARGVARSLLCQAAVFHCPDDLRIAVIAADAQAGGEWEWIKWLPHSHPPAAEPTGECAAGPALALSAERADELLRGIGGGGTPPAHLLLVVDGWSPHGPLAEVARLRTLMREGAAREVTVLCLLRNAADEPAELRTRLALEADGSATLEIADESWRRSPSFRDEPLTRRTAETIARLLAPLRVDGTSRTVPATRSGSTLAEALGLGDLPEIDVTQVWQRGAGSLLRTPIGTGSGGSTVVLDLKEAAHGGMGPHGMLVGATGSGKSELLRTLVAGLAVSHPPDLLAFVLVDFKGGAAFQPLVPLPHVAGVVTNLEDEPTMVERFRMAVEGELVRRQALFRSAGSVPDIRTYRRRCGADPDLEQLPYLLLVVDEFAELLAHHPDFDAFFEQVARLGRALGVHLLLATQGLSGGLSRLDRHLSYRLCLRTNSLQESLAVLGSPGAAQLPLTPGFGFLKVGQGQADGFQAFLVGGRHRGGDCERGNRDPSPAVREFLATGDGREGPEADAAASALRPANAGARTDLEVLVERIAGQEADPAHRVWLPPLPRALPLSSVLERDGRPLMVGLGLADHPRRQEQHRWAIDFAGRDGHLAVVGAPRSGRSTALRTLAASFLVTHDPRLVQLYILDMGGALQALRSTPHVGAVAGKNEPELARRIIRLLRRLVDTRDQEARRLGLGGIEELRLRWRERGSEDGFGDVFLIIDNWGAATREWDWIDEEVTALAGVGLSHGVHVVLSADRWGDIRPSLRDRIPGRLQLPPIDPGDSAYDVRATRALPPIPGRALGSGGCQVQLALPRVDGGCSAADSDAGFRDLIATAALRGPAAPRVRLLPATVPLASFDWEGWRRRRAVPIGISDADLLPVPFDLFSPPTPHLMVCGDPRSGRSSFLRALMAAIARVHTPDEVRFHIIDVRRSLLDAVPDAYVAAHAMAATGVEAVVEGLRDELVRRAPPPDASRHELAQRRHVRGPELVLVVDDDDLLDPLALRPLAATVVLAWDLKLHVVLARRPAPPGYDSLGSTLMGCGPAAVELSEADRSLFVPRPVLLPPGRAHLVVHGQATLLQLIHPDECP